MTFQIINPDTIQKSMLENKAMIQQFIELYLIQCPVDFQELDESVQTRDHIAISSAAHHIKPTMSYIGAVDLKEHLQQIEDMANQKINISSILEKYEEIKSMYNRLIEELTYYNNNL